MRREVILGSEHIFVQLAFPFRDSRCDSCIAGHIGERSHHIEQTIKGQNKANDQEGLLFRNADLRKWK